MGFFLLSLGSLLRALPSQRFLFLRCKDQVLAAKVGLLMIGARGRYGEKLAQEEDSRSVESS